MRNPIPLTAITLLRAVNLPAATHYVSPESTNPMPPYTNWVTAATNIQDAVDAAAPGDHVVVTNGVYATGGTTAGPGYAASRVYVGKPVALLSVNGPQLTTILGDQVCEISPGPFWDLLITGPQCVTLGDGASLTGFTLTKGMGYCGGGVWCSSTNATLTNCVIVGNSAPGDSGEGEGGGAWQGSLYQCVLAGNTADYAGGGAAGGQLYNCVLRDNSTKYSQGQGGGAAYASTLYNCTVTGNSNYGLGGIGGVAHSTLYNCIISDNTAGGAPSNYESSSLFTYCCTMPLPEGVGNIMSPPLFIDYASGNLRLQSNSACVNAGTNRYAARPTDLDGRPRIVGGRVDMGAYEFQPNVSGEFMGWLQQYGLPTDGSAGYADSDHDGLSNWQEWVCGTCPTNPQSALRLLSAVPSNTNVTVTWQSVAGVNYFLERSTNLTAPFGHLASFIMGQAGTTSYADTNVAGTGQLFYRAGVQCP
jgi:hypothetical protein